MQTEQTCMILKVVCACYVADKEIKKNILYKIRCQCYIKRNQCHSSELCNIFVENASLKHCALYQIKNVGWINSS